jgi:hypothetical protein
MTDSVATFYDGLAADYHLIFEDWDAVIEERLLPTDRARENAARR